MFMYALNEVAPASAQKSTMRFASAASFSVYICSNGFPGPCRYGPVASIHGPGFLPSLMACATASSPYPFRSPVVRMLVTPPAR